MGPLSGAVLCRLVEQILLWPPSAPNTPQSWSRSPPPLHGPGATVDGHKERVKILLADFLMEKRGNWKSPADSASTPSVPQSRVGFAKKAREIAPGDRKIEIPKKSKKLSKKFQKRRRGR